jgi:hypothetical protein
VILILLLGAVAGVLLWVLETTPQIPHGLDSFDVPPPVPYDGPFPGEDFPE